MEEDPEVALGDLQCARDLVTFQLFDVAGEDGEALQLGESTEGLLDHGHGAASIGGVHGAPGVVREALRPRLEVLFEVPRGALSALAPEVVRRLPHEDPYEEAPRISAARIEGRRGLDRREKRALDEVARDRRITDCPEREASEERLDIADGGLIEDRSLHRVVEVLRDVARDCMPEKRSFARRYDLAEVARALHLRSEKT